jgi:hypothetical protein
MTTYRFGAPRTDQLRVSDAERQAVTDRLAQHYGDGRLDQAEFDDRVGRAMTAKTRADLDGLFHDLPGLDGMAGSGLAGAPGAPDRRARRQMRHRHGLLKVALFVVIVLIAAQAAHSLFWLTVPWLWLGIVVLIWLAATGHLRRSGS